MSDTSLIRMPAMLPAPPRVPWPSWSRARALWWSGAGDGLLDRLPPGRAGHRRAGAGAGHGLLGHDGPVSQVDGLLAGPHALPLPAIVSICRRAHCARYPCSGFLTPLGRGVGSGVIGLRHLAVVL